MNRFMFPGALIALCLACTSGKIERIPAAQPSKQINSVVIQGNREAVWAKAIPNLGKTFFVINNLDKASGLINVSYTGDPENYVDGGQLTSTVDSPQGKYSITFPKARGAQIYQAAVPMRNGMTLPASINRRLTLEGRVNIIVEEISKEETKVTVNARYVLTKDVQIRVSNGFREDLHNTLSMNTNGSSTFPNEPDTYFPTGKLEAEVLSVFKM